MAKGRSLGLQSDVKWRTIRTPMPTEAATAPAPHVLHIADHRHTRELLCGGHLAVTTTTMAFAERFPQSRICPQCLTAYKVLIIDQAKRNSPKEHDEIG
jgi:hypothetical protein